jgi:hypothetical protein
MRLLCRCNKILYDSFSLFTPPISSTHIIRQCFSFRGQFSTQLRQTGDERNHSEDTFSVKNRMSSCSSQLSSETVKLQVFQAKKCNHSRKRFTMERLAWPPTFPDFTTLQTSGHSTSKALSNLLGMSDTNLRGDFKFLGYKKAGIRI